MAKLPYLMLYPDAYIRDTRPLPDFCKGIWMDCLCYLHESPTRGTATMPLKDWVRYCGTSHAHMLTALETFKLFSICDMSHDSHGLVTLTSRRMLKEEKRREQNRLRKQEERRHAGVTQQSRAMSRPNTSTYPNTISTNSSIPDEEKKKKYTLVGHRPNGQALSLFEEFWKRYPARNGKKLERAATQDRFFKLTEADQALLVTAASHYADGLKDSKISPKDPKRFIRDGEGHEPWRDWITPAVNIPPIPGTDDPLGRTLWRKRYGHVQRE